MIDLTGILKLLLLSAGITLILPSPDSIHANPLSDLETRGQQIYRKGESPGSPIYAYYGPLKNEITARLLPCVNCHRLNGIGKPEGGIEPPNITWKELTKPYGHKHTSGRKHPPFDNQALTAAITQGVDPAGNELDQAMPRYRISPQDLEALVAYLQVLGTDLSPGLTESAIKVGVLLPSKSSALYSMIANYFRELNDSGGIYGRKIEFVFAKASQDPHSYAESVRRLIEVEEVFALLGTSIGEADREVIPLLKSGDVPFVTPLVIIGMSEIMQENHRFSILPGLAQQSRTLAAFADRELRLNRKSAVVLPSIGGATNQIREAIFREAKARGWPEPKEVRYSRRDENSSEIVADLKQSGIDALFYFGPPGGLVPLMKDAEKMNWLPYLFVTGMLSAHTVFSLPPAFADRVFLANPIIPDDFQESSLTEFNRLLNKYEIPRQNQLQMLFFYATTKVFVEGLRRSGRSLGRDNFMRSLEYMADFETGLTPKISFNRNRRTGSLGSYILQVDLVKRKFKSNPVWIDLD